MGLTERFKTKCYGTNIYVNSELMDTRCKLDDLIKLNIRNTYRANKLHTLTALTLEIQQCIKNVLFNFQLCNMK